MLSLWPSRESIVPQDGQSDSTIVIASKKHGSENRCRRLAPEFFESLATKAEHKLVMVTDMRPFDDLADLLASREDQRNSDSAIEEAFCQEDLFEPLAMTN